MPEFLELLEWKNVNATTKSLLKIIAGEQGTELLFLGAVKVIVETNNSFVKRGQSAKNSDLAKALEDAKLPIPGNDFLNYANRVTNTIKGIQAKTGELLQEFKKTSSSRILNASAKIKLAKLDQLSPYNLNISKAAAFISGNILKADFVNVYYFVGMINAEPQFVKDVLEYLNEWSYKNDLSQFMQGLLLMIALDLTPTSHQQTNGVNKVLECVLQNMLKAADDYLRAIPQRGRNNNREGQRHRDAELSELPIFYKAGLVLLAACDKVTPKPEWDVHSFDHNPILFALHLGYQEQYIYPALNNRPSIKNRGKTNNVPDSHDSKYEILKPELTLIQFLLQKTRKLPELDDGEKNKVLECLVNWSCDRDLQFSRILPIVMAFSHPETLKVASTDLESFYRLIVTHLTDEPLLYTRFILSITELAKLLSKDSITSKDFSRYFGLAYKVETKEIDNNQFQSTEPSVKLIPIRSTDIETESLSPSTKGEFLTSRTMLLFAIIFDPFLSEAKEEKNNYNETCQFLTSSLLAEHKSTRKRVEMLKLFRKGLGYFIEDRQQVFDKIKIIYTAIRNKIKDANEDLDDTEFKEKEQMN